MDTTRDVSPVTTAAAGALGLAAAVGIGRFAFTPLMPLMAAQSGLTLAQGGVLAAANYAGYLAGALWCLFAHPAPGRAARIGLAGVALFTLAMGMTSQFASWFALRALAGFASALVLVGISGWTLQGLARADRGHWSGWVFAGVGVGIAFAGIATLVIGVLGVSTAAGWLVLGAVVAAVTASTWRPLATPEAGTLTPAPANDRTRFDADAWRLVACYGVAGFGYIIPATFLPALARQLVADPAVFGWTWPAFGAAAAASTVAAALLRHAAPRRVWAASQALMAAGVVAPALASSLGVLLAAALGIGGTFMVVTMAGMQEARRIARNGAARLIAAMTAAFAVGQLLGPLAVSLLASGGNALRASSITAGALLLASAGFLVAPRRCREAPVRIGDST